MSRFYQTVEFNPIPYKQNWNSPILFGNVGYLTVILPLDDEDCIERFDNTDDACLKVWTRDWRCFVLNDDGTFDESA